MRLCDLTYIAQGQIQEFVKRGRSLPYFPQPSHPFSPLPPSLSLPLEVGPLKLARWSGGALSSKSGVQGGAPVENEFDAL